VIFLEFVEPWAHIFASINVMKWVMTDIICHIANKEKGPEESKENGVWYDEYSQQCVDSNQKGTNSQKGWINKAITKLKEIYGSFGSMWWMPCIMKWR
jgi:hypothetical protein